MLRPQALSSGGFRALSQRTSPPPQALSDAKDDDEKTRLQTLSTHLGSCDDALKAYLDELGKYGDKVAASEFFADGFDKAMDDYLRLSHMYNKL